MAEYIGSAQFGQPINFSSQKDGERYPSWINTDYSGLFDAIGESISGVITAKKEALEKEKEEEKKNQAAYSELIDKYFIDTPEAGDDSEYFLGKVTEYNDKAKSYIEGAISSGNNYLTPEQIVELKKLSNQILSEKNLSELNQQTANQIRSKFFEADAQYEVEDFDKWMDGYNKQTTIQDKAKYIKNNERPLVPIVTLSDAAADLRKKNIGTTEQKVGNTTVTVIDPKRTEETIDLLLENDPTSAVAKYINKGATDEEKEKRRDDLVKMMGIQTDTKPYRASAVRAKSTSSGSQKDDPTGYDPKIGTEYDVNFINAKGLSNEGTLKDDTGTDRTNAVIEQIQIGDNGVVYAVGTYKNALGDTQRARFNYTDNVGAFEGAVGKKNIEKMINSKKKEKEKSNNTKSNSTSNGGAARFGKKK